MNDPSLTDIWFWLGLVASMGFLIFFSQRLRSSSNSKNSFLFNDQKTSLFPLVATLVMTEFNPATLLAFSGVAYYVGLYALVLPLVFLFGLLFYTFTVARAWRDLGETSVAALFKNKYGSLLGQMASFLLILAMVGFSSAYIKSLVLFLKPIFPETSIFLLAGSTVILFLIWTLKDGLVSIIRFDIGSFISSLLLLPVLVFYSFNSLGIGFSQLSVPDNAYEILPPAFVGGLVLLTMMTYISSPWYGQKIFSAKDSRTAFLGVGISSVLVFLLYSIPIVAVAALREKGIALASGEEGLPYLINQTLPSFPRGLLFATILMIGGTTLTSLWNAQASMVTVDFLQQSKDDKSVNKTRFYVFLFALLSFCGGVTLQEAVLSRLILANIPIFALSFALLAGFHWQRVTKFGAYLSIMTGLSWGVFCYLYFGESGNYTYYWSFYGVPVVFLSGILGSLGSQNKN